MTDQAGGIHESDRLDKATESISYAGILTDYYTITCRLLCSLSRGNTTVYGKFVPLRCSAVSTLLTLSSRFTLREVFDRRELSSKLLELPKADRRVDDRGPGKTDIVTHL
jgi:hypothetical protein